MRFMLLCAAILVLGSGLACASDLPSERPADFRAELHSDGGMLPRSHSFEVQADGVATFTLNWSGETYTLTRTLSAQDLDALYEAFRANRFDQIEVNEEREVYDRGGVSLVIWANGERYRVSDSGNSFVEEAWDDEFNAALAAMSAQIRPIWQEGGIPITVQFDPSQVGRPVAIKVHGFVVFEGNVPESAEVTLHLPEAPCPMHLNFGDVDQSVDPTGFGGTTFTATPGLRLLVIPAPPGHSLTIRDASQESEGE
ncbi:MAG: hypothetical protein KC561_04750 [Myxococcales bacterium]|nr:hypothetical protein [Myxococcales bacterium]